MYVCETPEEAIIRLHKRGFSIRDIKCGLRVGSDRIRNAIRYYDEHNEIPQPKKKGRPTKESDNILLMISMLTINDRTMTCLQISQKIYEDVLLNISPTTVFRYKKKLRFEYKPPKIRQFLNPQQIYNRVLFSHSMLASSIDFTKLVFSDESRFCILNDGQFKWFRKGEIQENVFQDKTKFTAGIMVFGVIGQDYKSKLVISQNSIDDVQYRKNIKESGMCEDLDARYGKGGFIFVQDGASSHTSHNTALHLKKICSYLKVWPSNSPDLNPIEHLWGAMKRILKTMKINSKAELIQKVLEIWDAFPMDSINSLVTSFHGRLRTVFAENGSSISDKLRSGIHKAPLIVLPFREDLLGFEDLVSLNDPDIDDQPIEFISKRKFNDEEDILLLKLVGTYGKKWKYISQCFVGRTPMSLRNRYNYIRK